MRDIVSPLDGFLSPFGRRAGLSSLFSSGQPGHWPDGYNPARGRLFQDALGTTPVTAPGQPVGLVLDMSQGGGRGPELVTNGDFSAGATGWTIGAGWAISGGAASFNNPTGTSLAQTGLPVMPAGRTIEVSFDLSYVSGAGVTVGLNVGGGIDSGGSFISSGRKTTRILTTANRSGISFTGIGNSVFSIDNISVRELPGNHASQATALSRPTLGRWPRGGRRNLLPNSTSTGAVAGPTGTPPTGWSWGAGAGPLAISGDELTFTAAGNRIIMSPASIPFAANEVQVWSATCVANPDGMPMAQMFVPINVTGLASFPGYANGLPVTYSTYVPQPGDRLHYVLTALSAATSVTYRIGVGAVGVVTGTATLRDPQAERGAVQTAYQRVVSDFDITEAGVPDVWHLSSDGGDWLFVTPPAGTYGRARITTLGSVIVDTVVNPNGALISASQRDIILRQGAFSAAEEAQIRAYWARYAA